MCMHALLRALAYNTRRAAVGLCAACMHFLGAVGAQCGGAMGAQWWRFGCKICSSIESAMIYSPWPRSQQPWKELAAHPTTPRRAANRAAGEPKGRCHALRPRWPTPPTVARHSTQRSLLHCFMHALAATATIFQREQLADVSGDAARARELSRETNRRRLE